MINSSLITCSTASSSCLCMDRPSLWTNKFLCSHIECCGFHIFHMNWLIHVVPVVFFPKASKYAPCSLLHDLCTYPNITVHHHSSSWSCIIFWTDSSKKSNSSSSLWFLHWDIVLLPLPILRLHCYSSSTPVSPLCLYSSIMWHLHAHSELHVPPSHYLSDIWDIWNGIDLSNTPAICLLRTYHKTT